MSTTSPILLERALEMTLRASGYKAIAAEDVPVLARRVLLRLQTADLDSKVNDEMLATALERPMTLFAPETFAHSAQYCS